WRWCTTRWGELVGRQRLTSGRGGRGSCRAASHVGGDRRSLANEARPARPGPPPPAPGTFSPPFLQPPLAVLHLPAVGFQPDRPGRRQLQRLLQHLAVAGAVSDVVLHHHHDLVPVLCLVLLQLLVRPGDQVVAHLQLRPAQEQAAVGVHRRPELQAQLEVLRELLHRPQLLALLAGLAGVDDDHAVLRRVPAVVGLLLAVERRPALVLPPRQVLAVEQLDLPVLRLVLRPQRDERDAQ